MITARAFAGNHYAVYGLARSGIATVEALLASGAKVTAWDENPEARSSLQAKLVGRGTAAAGSGGGVLSAPDPSTIESAFDGPPPHAAHREELIIAPLDDLTQFDSLILSPGVPLNTHPLAARAREAGVEIIGDIELFARARPELPPHKVVGITGTNGKSTTTALVHHILRTAGVPTRMGGNIGLPILAQEPLTPNANGVGVYVLELSSYQIDLTQSLDCDVAVLLDITPDHLERYGTIAAYVDSKLRLFEMQSAHNLAVYSAQFISHLIRMRLGDGHRSEEIWNDDERLLALQPGWPALQGPHNAKNAAAALEVCAELNVPARAVSAAMKSFSGLPHRMERIREKDGVLFVNDSKATNAEAAAPALAAYPKVRWIVGGQAKTHELGDTALHLDHVVKAYTIGEAGPMFARLLAAEGVVVEQCETLENAVKRAAEDSQSGETVLLSPACASFDQFRDFEARGDRFRELVGAQ